MKWGQCVLSGLLLIIVSGVINLNIGLADPVRSKILIKNASWIITMEPEMGESVLGIIKDSGLLIDSTILKKGQISESPGIRVIDAKVKEDLLKAAQRSVKALKARLLIKVESE